MFGLLIIAIIIFAVVKHRRQRRKYARGEWCGSMGNYTKYADPDYWKQHANHAEGYARDFEHKINEKLEAKAQRFEEKMRRMFDHQTRKYGVPADAIDPSRNQPPPPQFKTEAERQAYIARPPRHPGSRLLYPPDVVRRRDRLPASYQLDHQPAFQWWHVPGRSMGYRIGEPFWRGVSDGDGFTSGCSSPRLRAKFSARSPRRRKCSATEKQASLDELTASFAHEIRNPIAAAKSLVQQMGEDPTSSENVEYAKVALDELAARRAQRFASAEVRQRGRLQIRKRQSGRGPGRRTDPDARQAGGQPGRRVAQLPGRTDGSRRRRQAAPGVPNIIDNAIDAMSDARRPPHRSRNSARTHRDGDGADS